MDFDGCVVWILMDSNLMSIKTFSEKSKNIFMGLNHHARTQFLLGCMALDMVPEPIKAQAR
jgi:hypothetical protein